MLLMGRAAVRQKKGTDGTSQCGREEEKAKEKLKRIENASEKKKKKGGRN